MTGFLRALALLLLIGGIFTSVMAAQAALNDDAYFRAAAALERHADHILFQAEYQAALARHTAYLVTAVVSAVAGVVGSAILLALAGVLSRLHRLEASATR